MEVESCFHVAHQISAELFCLDVDIDHQAESGLVDDHDLFADFMVSLLNVCNVRLARNRLAGMVEGILSLWVEQVDL